MKTPDIALIALAVGLTLTSMRTTAMELYHVGKVSPSEYAMLPSYCQKFASHLSPDLSKGTGLSPLESALTRGIGGLHHYCRIPVLRSRYFGERDNAKKAFLLTEIIDEANYLIRHSQPDAPLLGQVYLERARAYVDRKQRAEAVKDYLQAISLAPNIASPFLELSRLFGDLGDNAKALEYVTAGLRHNPHSRSLRQRYLELGGKPPFPEPHQPAPTTPNPPATPAPVPPPVAPPVTPPLAGEPAVQVEREQVREHSRQSAPEGAPAATGRNGQPPAANPYCRFCP